MRYRQSLRTDLERLRRALEAGEIVQARRVAHQIAGASRMVGAHEMAERAAAFEQADEDELAALVPEPKGAWPL